MEWPLDQNFGCAIVMVHFINLKTPNAVYWLRPSLGSELRNKMFRQEISSLFR